MGNKTVEVSQFLWGVGGKVCIRESVQNFVISNLKTYHGVLSQSCRSSGKKKGGGGVYCSRVTMAQGKQCICFLLFQDRETGKILFSCIY